MPNENSISRRAVRYVVNYEKKQGRMAEDVQSNPHFKGYDVLSYDKNNTKKRRIEVKGSTKKNGIPDCFETEFTEDKKLVANYMYVVNFTQKKPKLYIIPARAFKPFHLKKKIGYRISSTFKNYILPKYEV